MTRWHPSRVFRQERVFLSCCRPLAGWPRCMGHAENIASARTQFIGDHARCSGQNRPSKVHALRAVLARKLSAVSNSALFKAFTVMRLRKARRGSGWWACLALAIEADIIRYRLPLGIAVRLPCARPTKSIARAPARRPSSSTERRADGDLVLWSSPEAHARRGDGLATRQLKEPGDDGA